MFAAVDSLVLKRKQEAIQDFIFYCKFDQRCHRSLCTFAQILERVGHRKMSSGLKKWFQTAFDPMQTKDQLDTIAEKQYHSQLLSATWGFWRHRHLTRILNSQKALMGMMRIAKIAKRQETKEVWRFV